MNQELKQKWLEALQSGKYEQCQEFLNIDNKQFCCLGVLCEVAGLKSYQSTKSDIYYYEEYEFNCISDQPKDFPSVETQKYLADMNDKDEATFAEIADWIEANL